MKKKLIANFMATLIFLTTTRNFAFSLTGNNSDQKNPKQVTQNKDNKMSSISKKYNFLDYENLSNSEAFFKVYFNIDDENIYTKGIVLRIVNNLMLKDYTDKLGVTAELNEEKASFFDMAKNDSSTQHMLTNSPGMYFALGKYKDNPVEKNKIKEKITKFLSSNFKNNLEKIKISEKNVEEALVEIAFYLNSNYQAEKHYLENQYEKVDYLKLGQTTYELLCETFKDIFPESLNRSLKQKFKDDKKSVVEFAKKLSKYDKQQTEKSCKQARSLMIGFLKFITGNNDENKIKKTFNEYEKIEKIKDVQGDKLKNFFLDCFNKNPKKQNIINNIKYKIKQMSKVKNNISVDKYFNFKIKILNYFKAFEKYIHAIFDSFRFNKNEQKEIITFYENSIKSIGKHFNKNDKNLKNVIKHIVSCLEENLKYIKKSVEKKWKLFF